MGNDGQPAAAIKLGQWGRPLTPQNATSTFHSLDNLLNTAETPGSPCERRMSRTAWAKFKRRPRRGATGTLESQQVNGQERFWRVYSEAETEPIRGTDALSF